MVNAEGSYAAHRLMIRIAPIRRDTRSLASVPLMRPSEIHLSKHRMRTFSSRSNSSSAGSKTRVASSDVISETNLLAVTIFTIIILSYFSADVIVIGKRAVHPLKRALRHRAVNRTVPVDDYWPNIQ